MKTTYAVIFFLITLLSTSGLFAQVAVNTDGSTPNTSAMLDVKSTTKGMLIPRMTQTDRDGITSPATGLIVYQTDATTGFYFYNGTEWTHLSSVQKIDDLTDAKSDNDGSQDGSSIFLGIGAGTHDDGTDNQNVGVGYQALNANTTGSENTANGYQALQANTTGSGNTANGFRTLFSNTEGPDNTATGYYALFSNTIGSNNTANGNFSLYWNTTGSDNTANGYATLYSNTTGYQNTANGYSALFYNTTGYKNTANGYSSLKYNTTGNENTTNGYRALYHHTTGDKNTANGCKALFSDTTGNNNTAIGYNAGFNSTGDSNIFLGNNSGYSETGSNKLYIENSDANADNALIYGEFDNDILRTNSTFQIGNPATTNGYQFPTEDGSANQVLKTDGSGTLTWATDTTGATKIDDLSDAKSDSDGSSIFIGIDAGLIDDGTDNRNVGMGYQVLNSNNTGSHNTATGYQALYSNTTGNYNTANGYAALSANTTGNNNTATGLQTLYSNKANSGSVAYGFGAMHNADNRTSGRNTYNTAIGYEALSGSTTPSNNT